MSLYRIPALRLFASCVFCLFLNVAVPAQSTTEKPKAATDKSAESATSSGTKSDLDEVLRLLRKQQEEIERLRVTVTEQSREITDLRQRVDRTSEQSAQPAVLVRAADVATSDTVTSDQQKPSTSKSQPQDIESRVGRVETELKKTSEAISKQLGSLTFSGDIRMRYESIYGQFNTLANADNALIIGNVLSARHRFRLRARLSIRGQVSKEFDWGLRFGSGSFADVISNNQTLTDFFNRKPFGLDNAFIAYSPQRIPGLRIQGGKFDVPWVRTELTVDNDVTPEGFSETYSRGFKNSKLKNITLVAMQSPFLERNSAFVRNANGTVNLDETGRGGRDLALYAGQARARFEFTSDSALTLSVADLFYSGTQFITPIQVFGGIVQLPVTVTIPASGSTPAQTVTAQALIPRDLLVSGNANLGVSTATNNAINRDGRLSSGFNLVDIIGRLDLYQKSRFPVGFIFNFVTNTQTHDVVVAGPGGADLLLPNNENNGYWAELQVGKQRERGDWLFDYTFMRIEKDAVLTPFNASDINQQSDVRVHRFNINYTADARVVLSMTGFITQRPNGLLGVFGNTPPGSLDRPTVRLQFDTMFRF